MQPSMLGFVQRTSFEGVTCSVAQCLDVVGEWWSLLIVRDAFLGVTRFDDFQARLGISRNILTRRLNHLVDGGVLRRVPYQDHPPRSEYRLTAKGRDLWHVVTAMRQWGDRWAAPGGPPVETRHTACGHVVTAVPSCSHCGEPLDARSVTAIPGPGASAADFDRTRLEGLGTLASDPGVGAGAFGAMSTTVASGPDRLGARPGQADERAT
jgi:DNA-binding HxlR family transcriptional regulator